MSYQSIKFKAALQPGNLSNTRVISRASVYASPDQAVNWVMPVSSPALIRPSPRDPPDLSGVDVITLLILYMHGY